MSVPTHNIEGSSAVEISASVEERIREGRLGPGDALPTVRLLAAALRVSPSTVAAAYRTLRARGLVVSAGRRGTAVSSRPPLTTRPALSVPRGTRDLASGNPDPALLPDLEPVVRALSPGKILYGHAANDPELEQLARKRFRAHGVPVGETGGIGVVAGCLDGIERVLSAHLRAGDRVAVEDPGFTGVFDLLAALGLAPIGVALDDEGALPDRLDAALRGGCSAFICTPRAQNPSGAAFSEARARALCKILLKHRDVLVIEDDHAGSASGATAHSILDERLARWASIHSVSKTLGPDLRLAVMATDPGTLARVEGRQLLGMRWVSHILQRITATLWKDKTVEKTVRDAGRIYTTRRRALVEALAQQGIASHGVSGLNVWVPVREEAGAMQALLEAGYAVAAGERFRLGSGPGVRITTARLLPEEAEAVAAALALALRPGRGGNLV